MCVCTSYLQESGLLPAINDKMDSLSTVTPFLICPNSKEGIVHIPSLGGVQAIAVTSDSVDKHKGIPLPSPSSQSSRFCLLLMQTVA